MVKAPILSPTPPSSLPTSPNHQYLNHDDIINDNNSRIVESTTTTTTNNNNSNYVEQQISNCFNCNHENNTNSYVNNYTNNNNTNGSNNNTSHRNNRVLHRDSQTQTSLSFEDEEIEEEEEEEEDDEEEVEDEEVEDEEVEDEEVEDEEEEEEEEKVEKEEIKKEEGEQKDVGINIIDNSELIFENSLESNEIQLMENSLVNSVPVNEMLMISNPVDNDSINEYVNDYEQLSNNDLNLNQIECYQNSNINQYQLSTIYEQDGNENNYYDIRIDGNLMNEIPYILYNESLESYENIASIQYLNDGEKYNENNLIISLAPNQLLSANNTVMPTIVNTPPPPLTQAQQPIIPTLLSSGLTGQAQLLMGLTHQSLLNPLQLQSASQQQQISPPIPTLQPASPNRTIQNHCPQHSHIQHQPHCIAHSTHIHSTMTHAQSQSTAASTSGVQSTHLFPMQLISIPHQNTTNGQQLTTWPIVETPIYVDGGTEHHHHIPFCPAHPQGPLPGSVAAAVVAAQTAAAASQAAVNSQINNQVVSVSQQQSQLQIQQHHQQTSQQSLQPNNREHRVMLQVDAGVTLPLQVAGKRKLFRGPTTVQMVSQNRPPPIPVPVQVPQGQVMQQYVNENGTLTHVVLSPTQYQQLHAGQGGVPHIHAPFITANGTTQHFYGPLPTGFPSGGGPPPHYHPMAPTGTSGTGHLQPQQQPQQISHSPSPPNNYHKDERTQRQHSKLLRKLDQKRSEMNSMTTPNHSPRKSTDLNSLRRTATRNGASSVGTSEDGEESSSVPDEEDDCQTIIDQLSAIPKPEVSEITSRSAMIRWEAPSISPEICIIKCDLRYDVLLSDRGREGKYKMIFKGDSYVCLIQDLRPGQEYYVCLQVHYEKLQGCPSEPAVFITPPCEPDQPMPPKLIARTKNSLQLRWQAPFENGSHILQYILEFDEGKGKGFIEITKTKGKQYTLSKLQSSTLFSFRLTAVNECGASLYSDVIAYSTSGNPPSTPKPPQLQAATSNSLRLAWDRRPQDEEYILQMADRESGHGFLNKYAGPDVAYECKMLQRATIYHFRLKAENEAGSSQWSNEISFRTQPERPGRPSKPQVKGKIHGNFFKAKWEPPNDRGGAEIRRYFLEISSGAKFERIYSGSEAETVCDRLSPGTTYQIRVSCEGPGGISGYSDVSTVTTEAIQPGAPDPPYYENPPGPYAAVIRWYSPDYNGGAPVLEYEVKLICIPELIEEIVYRGKDMYCVCKNLQPGGSYEASIRAVNRIGAGQWSEPLKFNAGAAPPQAPTELEIVIRSPTHLLVSWKQPQSNGSPIHEYHLESCTSIESHTNFVMCYQGPHTQADLRNLIPDTLYYFRVSASNMAGHSPFSKIIEQKTPAACPGQPQFTSSECTATEIILQWTEPDCNGSAILNYQIEYSTGSPPERFSISTDSPVTEYTIASLVPETSYKFKIQAVNEIGFGQPSNSLKLVTLPPPPEPPNLECTGIGHNFLKLKWGEGRNLDFTEYYLEMYNNRIKDFQLIHSGTTLMHKINKLQEQTEYIFRICAATDRAGTGEYSPECIFKTSASLPSNIKSPRIIESVATEINLINTTTGTSLPLTIEWQHSKNIFNDPIEYILQYSNTGKESDYTEVYRGPETKFTYENVEPGCIYLFRVLPVRCTQLYGDLAGQFSPSLRYQVPHTKLNHQITLNRDEQHLHNRLNHTSNGGLLLSSTLGSSSTPLTSSANLLLTQNLTNDYDNVDDNMLQINNLNGINGALKRFQTKCYQWYNRRKRLTDNQKAALLVFSFILLTCIFASIVSLFMG